MARTRRKVSPVRIRSLSAARSVMEKRYASSATLTATLAASRSRGFTSAAGGGSSIQDLDGVDVRAFGAGPARETRIDLAVLDLDVARRAEADVAEVEIAVTREHAWNTSVPAEPAQPDESERALRRGRRVEGHRLAG